MRQDCNVSLATLQWLQWQVYSNQSGNNGWMLGCHIFLDLNIFRVVLANIPFLRFRSFTLSLVVTAWDYWMTTQQSYESSINWSPSTTSRMAAWRMHGRDTDSPGTHVAAAACANVRWTPSAPRASLLPGVKIFFDLWVAMDACTNGWLIIF